MKTCLTVKTCKDQVLPTPPPAPQKGVPGGGGVTVVTDLKTTPPVTRYSVTGGGGVVNQPLIRRGGAPLGPNFRQKNLLGVRLVPCGIQ